MSSAMEADSSGAVGQLQEAKKPMSVVAELQAGTAELEQVQETDVPTRMAGSRAAVLLLSDGENGMEWRRRLKVTECCQSAQFCCHMVNGDEMEMVWAKTEMGGFCFWKEMELS